MTNLGFFSSNSQHVLKKPFQDTFDFQQESGTVAFLGIYTAGQAEFGDLVPRCSGKSIKDI